MWCDLDALFDETLIAVSSDVVGRLLGDATLASVCPHSPAPEQADIGGTRLAREPGPG
jgi:hypothetical protein